MTDTLRDLVAQLHRPAMPGSLSALAASGEAQFCQECSHIWPCATYRALSASDTQPRTCEHGNTFTHGYCDENGNEMVCRPRPREESPK